LPGLPWLAAGLAGLAAPALALVLLAQANPGAVPLAGGAAILALGLMGAGMIGAAAAGRLAAGIILAMASGAGLLMLGLATGMAAPSEPAALGLAAILASLSFAARGALFARSAAPRGWWVAVAVVAGEAAMLATAAAMPGTVPDWLLALLPAQWASAALRTALGGAGTLAASSELLALAGTAGATLLVARLWPRRWPYLVMFTAWLALSALVLHRPAPVPPPASIIAADARIHS
jgi:hypothetical protein